MLEVVEEAEEEAVKLLTTEETISKISLEIKINSTREEIEAVAEEEVEANIETQ